MFKLPGWMLKLIVGLGLSGICLTSAWAHKPSDSYINLSFSGTRIDLRWDVALRDLDMVLGLDVDDDGLLRWGEVRTRTEQINNLLTSQLGFADGNSLQACTYLPQASALQLDQHSDGTYIVWRRTLNCPLNLESLQLTYRLFALSDPTHHGIVRVINHQQQAGPVHIFSPEQPVQRIALTQVSAWRTWATFVQEGVWHILQGFDHLLFLAALLLTSVLIQAAPVQAEPKRTWIPAPRLGPAITDVLKIVTAFTVAHSLTLTLAALNIVSLPSRFVESCIALTVILAALNNLYPLVHQRRWWVAFGFGLIHGFGFASALKDLGLQHGLLALSLFGFNSGVELGQLMALTLAFPLAFMSRRQSWYRPVVLQAGSLAIFLLAMIWLVERVFDIALL